MDKRQLLTILSKKASVTLPWYRAGGIPAANCIGAYKAIGAADLATSYVNLANPGTYDCSLGEAPTFDASYGWSFNGTSNYLKTGIVPAHDQTWSMAIRFTEGAASKPLAGIDNAGTNDFGLYTTVYYYNYNLVNKAPAKASGILMVCGVNCFRETVNEGTIAAGSGSNTQMVYIGATSRSGSPTAYGASKIQALAIWNIDISAYQASVHAAMAALA